MRRTTKSYGDKVIKDIKRASRKRFSGEVTIRIALDGIVAQFG